LIIFITRKRCFLQRILVMNSLISKSHIRPSTLRKPISSLEEEFPLRSYVKRFWNDKTNQLRYLNWLELQLNISSKEQWYGVTIRDVRDRGGRGLLAKYDDSLQKALICIFPSWNWKSWMFRTTMKHFWNSDDNVKSYLVWLSEIIGIYQMKNWIEFPRVIFTRHKGSRLLHCYGGNLSLLMHYFPDHQWNRIPLKRTFSKTQLYLFKMIQVMFPNEEILLDYKYSQNFHRSFSNGMELDLFIPSLSLAFEYQGHQHYHCNSTSSPLEYRKRIDQLKAEICDRASITLLEIPCWWNGRFDSLWTIIAVSRPDMALLMSPKRDMFSCCEEEQPSIRAMHSIGSPSMLIPAAYAIRWKLL